VLGVPPGSAKHQLGEVICGGIVRVFRDCRGQFISVLVDLLLEITLPSEIDSKCDREPVQRAMVTAKLFGIDGVPFLIAPDGRIFKGAPDSLTDWLANKLTPRVEAIQPPSKAAVVPPDSAKTSNTGGDAKP